MVLLVRLLVAAAVGIAASWIVYAFAGGPLGTKCIVVAALGGLFAFWLVGRSAWYERLREAAWERRVERMTGGSSPDQ